jgi:hypothetical protein
MPQTELIANGKRHGIAMTDYVRERIRDRKITPAVVADVLAANVHQHANEMLAQGTVVQQRPFWPVALIFLGGALTLCWMALLGWLAGWAIGIW